MNVDEVKTIADKFAVVIDSINRLLFLGAMVAVCVMLFPCLYRIEKATTNTATRLEKLDDRVGSIDEKVTKYVSEKEWQQAKKIIQP